MPLCQQSFDAYNKYATPSVFIRLVLLPIEWHMQLSKDHPYGITLKAFYDIFLLPLQVIAGQPYTDVQTWWRHTATCTALTRAQARSGLQVATTQALPLGLHTSHDGWAQEQVKCLFKQLRARAPPLSSAAFKACMQLLQMDLATHHTASEARELAQHVD